MDENVKKSLEELHGHLSEAQAAQTADETKRAHLGEVTQAVRQTLDDPAANHHLTLRERLEQAVSVFETDHPQLSLSMQNAINALANAGL